MHAEKQDLYRRGLIIVNEFLDFNCIPRPTYIEGKVPHAMNKWQATGLYGFDTVYVDLTRTILPQRARGRVWSWPCFRTDKTAVGVLAHEVGHYIQDLVRREEFFAIATLRDPEMSPIKLFHRFNSLSVSEKSVTSYEPTYDEAFAEAMRLFITNPDLLRCGRPQRFAFLFKELGLLTRTEDPFYTVLSGCPDHIREIAFQFASRAR